MGKKLKFVVLFFFLLIISGGCDKTKDNATKVVEQVTVTPEIGKSFMDTSKEPEERTALLLEQMTINEKVGQMIQGAKGVVTDKEMTELSLGSILSGGGAYPGNNTIEDWRDMIREYQTAALATRLKIPMLYGIDAVHGNALVQNAVVYPHNIGIGAAGDTDLTYEMGKAVAEEMKLIHILWNFAPCAAVNSDPRWGRTYECYSSDTELVTKLADAYTRGLEDRGVAASAKHYLADGGTVYGTGEGSYLIDRGNVILSEEELRTRFLKPYEKLVASGVKTIMASFSSYQGVKMHENKYLLTDVLKNELKFEGFIVSDWEATSGLSGKNFKENVILAVNAGVDMLMEPNHYKRAVSIIVEGVKTGAIKEERVDDAVSRILKVKFELGLFEDPFFKKLPIEVSDFGEESYKKLAKQLVEKSLVLLKNENHVLPLKSGQKILVTGPAMDDIGLQCGGWGLTWQGVMEAQGRNINGISILEGLKEYAKSYGYEIITDKKREQEADAVILVIGEVPYAEYEGDTKDLSITGKKAHRGNKASISYVKGLKKPTITLLVAGRNTLIEEYKEDWDSIVMCYLPGTQGDGIAAVLSGEVPFTGKLPMPYYKSTKNIGTEKAEVLFPVGYGLTY